MCARVRGGCQRRIRTLRCRGIAETSRNPHHADRCLANARRFVRPQRDDALCQHWLGAQRGENVWQRLPPGKIDFRLQPRQPAAFAVLNCDHEAVADSRLEIDLRLAAALVASGTHDGGTGGECSAPPCTLIPRPCRSRRAWRGRTPPPRSDLAQCTCLPCATKALSSKPFVTPRFDGPSHRTPRQRPPDASQGAPSA